MSTTNGSVNLRACWGLFVSVALVSCAPADHTSANQKVPSSVRSDNATFASGKRLRARYRDLGGGAKVFVDFVDSELDTPCTLGHASDDAWYCQPGEVEWPLFFADDQCTVPVAVTYAGDRIEEFRGRLVVTSRSECVGTEGYVTDPVTLDKKSHAGPIYTLGKSCERYEPGTNAEAHAYVKADPRALVRMDEVLLERGPRLRARVLVGEDGSAFVHPVAYDAKLGMDCVPTKVDESQYVCAPPPYARDAGGAVGFGDAQCTRPLAEDIREDCEMAPAIVSVDECSGISSFFEVGEEMSHRPVWSPIADPDHPGACGLITQGGPHWDPSLYAQGAPIDPSKYAALSRRLVGEGPVRGALYAAGAGEPLVPLSEMEGPNGPCLLQDQSDGNATCMPSRDVGMLDFPGRSRGLFRDEACSEPAMLVAARDCGKTPKFARRDFADTSPPRVLGKPFKQSGYYELVDICRRSELAPGQYLFPETDETLDLPRLSIAEE